MVVIEGSAADACLAEALLCHGDASPLGSGQRHAGER